MEAAQFVFGQFNGETQKIFSSPNLESMLHPLSITRLMHLGKHVTEYTEHTNRFDTEKAVAYSFIYPIVDEEGRRSMWNHTIIIKFDDVLEDVKNIVRKHHISPKRTMNFLLPLTIPLE